MDAIHPLDIITTAWHMTSSAEVTGSSTICVVSSCLSCAKYSSSPIHSITCSPLCIPSQATLDKKLNQLSYSNIGDCGLMVIRHIDSETAGYMRERQLPRHLRTNDLRIAYLSQQQLRSFNLPYQVTDSVTGISATVLNDRPAALAGLLRGHPRLFRLLRDPRGRRHGLYPGHAR